MSQRERELRTRVQRDPDDADALRELARVVGRSRTGKDEAIDLWRRHLEVAAPSDRAAARLALAHALIQARREPEAIQTLRECTRDSPDAAEAFDLLGELLRRAGDLEEAVGALTRAIELEPDAVRPRVALVTCYDALGREREARAALQSLAGLGADDPAITALVRELMHRRA